MKLCLCGQSALSVWRHFDNRAPGIPVFGHTPNAGPLLPKAFPSKMLPAETNLQTIGASEALLSVCDFSKWGISADDCIHLLAARDNRSRPPRNVAVHWTTLDLPKGSILRIDSRICAVSPEYLVVQTSASSDLLDTCIAAYELCGCYSIRPDLEQGLIQRHPLCSTTSISRFLEKAEKLHGRRQTRKALSYVRDGSGSPRETALTLLLCLPMRYGGFGLPLPELNLNLNLGSTGKMLWSAGNAFDLVWKTARMVVEYDGDTHAGIESKERDDRRRDALATAGYSLIVVSKNQLANIKDTYVIAKTIATSLGKKLRFQKDGVFREKHLELRRRLLTFQT